MNAIRIRGVTKSFTSVIAVNDLSPDIPQGSIYGFIGPNGSGKTTTMRMIVGISHPDGGSIQVFGQEMSANSPTGVAGYLPEERGLYRKMTVRALLEFHGELRSGRNVSTDVTAWRGRLNLAEWADKRVETLSKGMTQKVQFIAAIVAEPKLVILDEPFSGLDPVSAGSIREAILDLRSRGATVVLSTHDMNTAETLCDSIFMIFQARKVLDGTLAEIQDLYGNDTIRIKAECGSTLMESVAGVESVHDLEQIQEIRMARDCDPQAPLREPIARTRVSEFSIARPSLHGAAAVRIHVCRGRHREGKARYQGAGHRDHRSDRRCRGRHCRNRAARQPRFALRQNERAADHARVRPRNSHARLREPRTAAAGAFGPRADA
jgi:ABC-2 type transport system ATP-binding protein